MSDRRMLERLVARRRVRLQAGGARPAEAGFAVTLEFLLIVALVALPILIGTFTYGRKLLTLAFTNRPAIDLPYANGVVWDSSATAKSLGPVIDYDQFKAPRIIFRDDANKLGVLLGVRTNRFTTVSKVYYGGLNCTGTAYVRTAVTLNDEVGILYHLQGINYAMGSGNLLYKEGSVPPAGVTILSIWTSQNNGNPNSPPATVPIAPDPGPVLACENVTVDVPFAILGLESITCDDSSGDAVFTATTVQAIPTALGPLSGAIVTYIGNDQNACQWIPHNEYDVFPSLECGPGDGTILNPVPWDVIITALGPPGQFTYIFNGPVGGAQTNMCPNGVFPPGQLRNTGLSGALTSAVAPYSVAALVADLDTAANYTRPYRLSFPTPGTPADPALPCPFAECGAPVPPNPGVLQCPNGECP